MPFQEKEFSLSNHVPPGGLGCFDAVFTPASGIMKVSVKVCPRLKLYHRLGTLSNQMKEQYLNTFREKVPEFWNGRFRMTLEKEGFNRLEVKPEFEVLESNLEDSHYDLVIWPNASETVDICVRTGEDPQLAQLRNTVYYKSEFDKYGGKRSAQFTQVTLELEDKTVSVLRFLSEPLQIAVGTKPGLTTKFSFTTMETLRSHANAISTCFTAWKKVPTLTIEAPRAGGKGLAEDVARIMKTFGLTAKYRLEAKGPDGIVKLSVDERQLQALTSQVQGALKNVPRIAQYASVHEYGHMLGLPDEYICYSAATVGLLAKKRIGLSSKEGEELELLRGKVGKGITPGQELSQTGFIKLCREYGLPVPPFGSKNPSLMSAGHQFLPCHAVTVADALQKMTHKYTSAKDWRVDLVK